jgi:phosphate transport system substrate-binding protein
VEQTAGKTPTDERISLIFAPGPESYPIINFEYVIVKQQQPSEQTAVALKNFLNWAISPTGGNAEHYMQAVGFVPLPPAIRELSSKQIASIRASSSSG